MKKAIFFVLIVSVILMYCTAFASEGRKKATFTYIASETSKTFITIPLQANLEAVKIIVPSWTNTSVTTTVTIADANGAPVYSSAPIPYNSNVVDQGMNDIPLIGAQTITVTLSGVPGAGGGTVTVYLEGEGL